jgi:adenine-specific DNA-methyltransferase
MGRAEADKLRGGYYTPPDVAVWLCNWAIRSRDDRILEPSSGDGVFLAAGAVRLLELGARSGDALQQIAGVEIEASEATKAADRLRQILGAHPNGKVACADFFGWLKTCPDRKYDCAVGNPPFIRYQNFPEPSRSRAMTLMSALGLRPNKLTNIWVPFVVGAASLLAEGGRLAFVVPAELLQVSYAAQLRRYLADHFRRIQLFACNHLVFAEAEQEIVLLLADGYSTNVRECHVELTAANRIDDVLSTKPSCRVRGDGRFLDHSTEKWLKYFLKPKEIALLRALKTHAELAPLAHHAEVDIGVVTGRNEFFVVSSKEIDDFRLAKYAAPLIGRSSQLRGAILTREEWQSFADAGQDVYLLLLQPPLNAGAQRYVTDGEARGFDRGYKCSIRDPWYTVPSVRTPDAFFFRQIYDFPRAVLNRAKAISTDTIHRMRCMRSPASIVANLYTHLTAASAEIEGRSYGGGVLELEPNEAERLLMPRTLRSATPLQEIDRLVRAGRLREVLTENDRLILRDTGLSASDCGMLKRIWLQMQERRRSRRK